MNAQSETHRCTVKLFLRADPELGCERQKQAVIDQLETLAARGQIDDYEVNIWTKEIRLSGPLEGTRYYQTVIDHFTAFQEWADETGVMLNAAFKTQSVDCEITGETYRVLSLPCICLAVYEDGELCAVYPHASGEMSQTASSCLEQLASAARINYVG